MEEWANTSFTIYTDCLYLVDWWNKVNEYSWGEVWMTGKTDKFKTSFPLLKSLYELVKKNGNELAIEHVTAHNKNTYNSAADFIAKKRAKQQYTSREEIRRVETFGRL